MHATITSSMQSEDVAETIELPGRFLNAFTVSEPKHKAQYRNQRFVCSSLVLEDQFRNRKEETEET